MRYIIKLFKKLFLSAAPYPGSNIPINTKIS